MNFLNVSEAKIQVKENLCGSIDISSLDPPSIAIGELLFCDFSNPVDVKLNQVMQDEEVELGRKVAAPICQKALCQIRNFQQFKVSETIRKYSEVVGQLFHCLIPSIFGPFESESYLQDRREARRPDPFVTSSNIHESLGFSAFI